MLGRRVRVIHDGPLAAGAHPLSFATAALPAGVYLVRATSTSGTMARRLIVH